MKYYNEDGTLRDDLWTRTEDSSVSDVTRTVQKNGKIRLSLPSHTEEKPRQIVLEPVGENKYYVHQRMWDDIENEIPASDVSNEEKK
jgi:hypothetical protein